MKINSIILGGFANIGRIELTLTELNALVAFNNYGKSNVLNGIEFGITFIKLPPHQKSNFMRNSLFVPINNKIAGEPFFFEIGFSIDTPSGKSYDVNYSYAFEWQNGTKQPTIVRERLRVKPSAVAKAKYTQYLQRNEHSGYYLPNPMGRCDKEILVESDYLILNKISHFDDLFFLDIVRSILSLSLLSVNTLQNPDHYFNLFMPHSITDYAVDMSGGVDPAFFIYSLMKLQPDNYQLLKSAILSLLPLVEDLEPIEVNLKELSPITDAESPFSRPEKFYDIRIKERYNNQQTGIRTVSAGSKKIIYILAMAIGAAINKLPLLMFEELENSIHPALFQSLLVTFNVICPNTKIVITSHSPYLVKYLSVDKIKIGVPNSDGLALFKDIKASKEKKILRMASEEGSSLGDYIFSLMYDAQMGDSDLLNEVCV